MAKKRSTRISTFGSQLTSIVSVALVLLILGILAVVAIAGRSGSDMLKSNLGFIVKVERTASESDVNRLKQRLNDAPYVASYVYSSAEEILATESEYLGEDIVAIVDVNPYGAEFDVKVLPAYAVADSIEAISAELTSDVAVNEVLTQSAMITAINAGIERITIILSVIAIALLVISIVLIFNTVHLAIYSRRFVMYTMKLVGATAMFIRKPYVIAGALNGLIAATLASIVLVGGLLYSANLDPLLAEVFTTRLYVMVIAMIYVVGLLLCSVASYFATTRYLRADYDDMFMK